jgi:hypothetical protein
VTRTDSAGPGDTVTQGGQLAKPLAVRLAPNGNLLAANATNGKIVEINPGRQASRRVLRHPRRGPTSGW